MQDDDDETLHWHAERICLDVLEGLLDVDEEAEEAEHRFSRSDSAFAVFPSKPSHAQPGNPIAWIGGYNPLDWIGGATDGQANSPTNQGKAIIQQDGDLDGQPSHQTLPDSKSDGNDVQPTQKESGEAPLRKPGWSVGAQLHHLGQCRPCAWHWKLPGCANGEDCEFCHACENGALQKRRKERIAQYKAERERLQEKKLGKRFESPAQALLPPHLWPPHLLPPHLVRSRFSPNTYSAMCTQTQFPGVHEGLGQVPNVVWRGDDMSNRYVSSKPSSEDTTPLTPVGGETNVLARLSF